MAARVSHVSILLLGFILFTRYLALVRGELPKEGVKIENFQLNPEEAGNDHTDYKLKTRGYPPVNVHRSINSNVRSFNNFGNTKGNQGSSGTVINIGPNGTRNIFNNEGQHVNSFIHFGNSDEVQDFSGATINAGPGTHNSFNNVGKGTQNFRGSTINFRGDTNDSFNIDGDGNINMNVNGPLANFGAGIDDDNGLFKILNGGFSGSFQSITHMGDVVDISTNGVTIRGLHLGDRKVSLQNEKVFVDDHIVCEDITKLPEKPTHQKSADGGMWYTNIKIGNPMDKADINKFEADWAQHLKFDEEWAAERDRWFGFNQQDVNGQHGQHGQHGQRMYDAVEQRLKRDAEEKERRFRRQQQDQVHMYGQKVGTPGRINGEAEYGPRPPPMGRRARRASRRGKSPVTPNAGSTPRSPPRSSPRPSPQLPPRSSTRSPPRSPSRSPPRSPSRSSLQY